MKGLPKLQVRQVVTTKHLIFLLVLFIAAGCTGEAGYKPVDFSERATHYPPVRDQEKWWKPSRVRAMTTTGW